MLDNLKVLNRVRLYPFSSYESAIENYLKKINLQDVKSVYQVGTISLPGISDIDLFLIFKDAKRDIYERYSIKKLSVDDKYLFSHNPLLMDERAFLNLYYWFPCFNLIHRYGDKIIERETKKVDEKISIIFLTQYLLTKIPIDFLVYGILNNRCHERLMLALIKSLSHLFTLVRNIFKHVPFEWEIYFKEYKNCLLSWFDFDDDEKKDKLKEYTLKALRISFELVDKVSRYIEKNVLMEPIGDELSFENRERKLVFVKKWTKMKAMDNLLSSSPTQINLSYPIAFAYYPLFWLRFSDGLIGKHICKSLSDNIKININNTFQEVMEKHVLTIENYARFHVQKFHVPISGYHTLWAPYHPLKWIRLFNKVSKINKEIISKVFHK